MEKAPKAPLNPKVKPALKHPVETKAEANANADKHPDRHLTWDEHAIEEHDLLRGTRMKIEEPDTPYAAYEAHSDDDRSISSARSSEERKSINDMPPLSWNALESKLQVVADKRNGECPPSPHGASDSEGEAEMKRRKAKIEEHETAFKAHRKKHYNEAEAMKRWRAEHMNDDDDEAGDDEEDTLTGVK